MRVLAIIILVCAAAPAMAHKRCFCPAVQIVEKTTVENKLNVTNNFVQVQNQNVDLLTNDLLEAMLLRLDRPRGQSRSFSFANNMPIYIQRQLAKAPEPVLLQSQAQGFFYQNVVSTGTAVQTKIVNKTQSETIQQVETTKKTVQQTETKKTVQP